MRWDVEAKRCLLISPEMLQSQHDVGIFCSGCVLATVHVIVLLRRVDCQAWWLSVRAASRWKCRARHEGDPSDAHVATLLASRQLERARNILLWSTWCVHVLMLGILSAVVVGNRRWLSPLGEILCVCGYAMVILVNSVPRLLQPGTLDLWYSLVMLLILFLVSPNNVCREVLPVLSEGLMCFRLLFGFMSLNLPVVMLWNGIYLGVVSYSYFTQNSECPGLAETNTFLACELMIFVLLGLTLSAAKSSMKSEVRQEIDAVTSRNERSAVAALLNTMSDAVVELDTEHRIVEDVPKLSCLLLHGSGRSLRGIRFDQFLASKEDSKRFSERLSEPLESQRSMANVLHVKMHDSMNNAIDVEVFHVSFQGLGHSMHHILGVRESGEMSMGRVPTADFNMIMMSDPTADSAASIYGTQGGASPDAEDIASDRRDEVIVTFDAFSFVVVGCSPAFSEIVVSVEPGRSCLADLMPDSWRSSFVKDFGACVNEFVHSDLEVSEHFKTSLKIRVPFSSSTDAILKCTCSIRLYTLETRSEDDDDEGPRISADAVLTNIRQAKLIKTHCGCGSPTGTRSRSSAASSGSSASSSGSESSRRREDRRGTRRCDTDGSQSSIRDANPWATSFDTILPL